MHSQAPVLMPCGSPVVCALARQNQPRSVCGCVLTVTLVTRGYSPTSVASQEDAAKLLRVTNKTMDIKGRNITIARQYAVEWWTNCLKVQDYMPKCASRPLRRPPIPGTIPALSDRASTRAPARSAPRSWPTTRACARAHTP